MEIISHQNVGEGVRCIIGNSPTLSLFFHKYIKNKTRHILVNLIVTPINPNLYLDYNMYFLIWKIGRGATAGRLFYYGIY